MSDRHDEFYVGYLLVPAGVKRFVVIIAALLILAGVTAAVLVASQQRSPGTGQWAFGQVSEYHGVIVERPYAMLIDDAGVTHLLVGEGKAGVVERVKGLDGRAVTLRATPLDRSGRHMLELASAEDAVEPTDATRDATPVEHKLGEVMLAGEIIDPKCYLGAMKPGGGKTHKACAALCLTGGIPPMFVTRSSGGGETFYLLTDADGGPVLDAVLPFVGEPVRLRGEVGRLGDLFILRLANGTIERP